MEANEGLMTNTSNTNKSPNNQNNKIKWSLCNLGKLNASDAEYFS
jgi:hypothetical protein